MYKHVCVILIVLFVVGLQPCRAAETTVGAADQSQDFSSKAHYERILAQFDFNSWKGKVQEKYTRTLSGFDLSGFKFPAVKIPATTSQMKDSGYTRLSVVARDERLVLARVTVLEWQDVLSAQTFLMESFADMSVRPANVAQIEIGDRGYGWGRERMCNVAFTRNNICVRVHTDPAHYSVLDLARQVDALILKMSRAPEKK